MLLERDSELAVISELIANARDSEPVVVLVQGPAGIGKTVLLERARREGVASGLQVLWARGGELEVEFPFGIVSQLFEPLIRGLSAGERSEVLAGAAALAGPVVAGTPAPSGAGEDRFSAVSHGLYWLTSNLADRGPLLLAVDDVQWADASSLRFLVFLIRRLTGLPVSMIMCLRAGETPADRVLLDQMVGEPIVRTVRPAGLSRAGVTQMVATGLGIEPDPIFADACLTATGGTPFLLQELVSSLAEDAVAPTAQAAPHVGAVAPATVAAVTLRRIARLPSEALPIARAVAVLGAHADVRRAGQLTGITTAAAVRAIDALALGHVLRLEPSPEFTHPILRTAVYEDMPPALRAAEHAHTADLLAADGADLNSVAAHTLLSLPVGRSDVIARLRSAAEVALAHGAPENAAAYLTRALQEGCGSEVRAQLLAELAAATRLTNLPEAVGSLREAIALTTDTRSCAVLTAELAQMLLYVGQWEQSSALVDAALDQLGDFDRELSVLLETLASGYAAFDPKIAARFERGRVSLQAAIDDRVPTARAPALLIAANSVLRGDSLDNVQALLEFGLEQVSSLPADSAYALVPQAFVALVHLEELDRADQLAEDLLAAARPLGSISVYLLTALHQAFIRTRRGDLRRAEGQMRAATEPMIEQGLLFGLPSLFWYGLDALTERPELDDVAHLALDLQIPDDFATTYSGAMLAEARGRLRAQQGQAHLALGEYRDAWAITQALGFRNPNLSNLRCELALLVAGEDPDEGRQIAQTAHDDAQRIGLPRAIGVCLRTLGILDGGEHGLTLLHQAVTVLEHSPARLEHARALVEVGAALRRDRHSAAARSPLRDGLALADRCGATRLVERARTELRAAGARPRRVARAGADSLTPTELRIAEMAAAGMSNPQIGQALFITRNTVETHLRHVYEKLSIRRREDIAASMTRPL